MTTLKAGSEGINASAKKITTLMYRQDKQENIKKTKVI